METAEQIARYELEDSLDQEINRPDDQILKDNSDFRRGSPEYKLDVIEAEILGLSSIENELAQNASMDKMAKFDLAAALLTERISKIKTLLISFEVAINIEYPKIHLTEKFLIGLISLFRKHIAEQTLIRVFGGNKAKRQALLRALKELLVLLQNKADCISFFQDKIREQRQAKIRPAQLAILANNSVYINLKTELEGVLLDQSSISQLTRSSADFHRKILEALYKKYINDPMPKYYDDLFTLLEAHLKVRIKIIKFKLKELGDDALLLAEQQS